MDELVLMYERKKRIEEGMEKGRAEERKEFTIKGIQKALQQGKLTVHEIADLFEVSVEFVQQVQHGEVK